MVGMIKLKKQRWNFLPDFLALFQPDHWNPSCTPDLQVCTSTVLTHAQLMHHSNKTFCLMSLFPVASSNSFNTSTLISATLWFIKTWNRVFSVFPLPHHCHHWWGPGFESFLGAGKLELASCGQQTFAISSWLPTVTCLHRQTIKCFAFVPSTSLWGQKKAPQAVRPPEPTPCLQLLDLFSAQVK